MRACLLVGKTALFSAERPFDHGKCRALHECPVSGNGPADLSTPHVSVLGRPQLNDLAASAIRCTASEVCSEPYFPYAATCSNGRNGSRAFVFYPFNTRQLKLLFDSREVI